MTRSTATFTARLFVAATSFAAAGLLTAAPATAQNPPSGSLTVNVYGDAPAPGGPGSVVGELTGPGAPGAQVTVTNLDTGATVDIANATTNGNGTVTVGKLPPGNYEIQVTGDGKTGVDYVAVGPNVDASSDFSLPGLPSSEAANGGVAAVDGLTDAVTDAQNSGDDQGAADAAGELDALGGQDEVAAERLEAMVEHMLEKLPDIVRENLEQELAGAETPEEVAAVFKKLRQNLVGDYFELGMTAVELGIPFRISRTAEEFEGVLEQLKGLERMMVRLKAHQQRLLATREARRRIASAAADNSQSYASVQHRMNARGNLQRNLVRVGRYVQPPRIPRAHRVPQVHRAPVEQRRVIRLEVGPSRRY